MTDSNDPFSFNKVGNEKMNQGIIDDSTNWIKDAPDNPGHYTFRNQAKEKLKDYKVAILEYKQAIEKIKEWSMKLRKQNKYCGFVKQLILSIN